MSSIKRSRRKIKKSVIKKIIILLLIFLVTLIGIFVLNRALAKNDNIKPNDISYKKATDLNVDIMSHGFLLYDIENREVLYARNNQDIFYPASLTKVMTLATTLRLENNLDNRSSLSNDEINKLINQNASLAYIKADYEYTLRDLLFALILPSGADAAKAIENYFYNKNIDFIYEMNETAKLLELKNTHFENSNGLHTDKNFTTIDDLLIILNYAYSNKNGKEVLTSMFHTLEDGNTIRSTLSYLESDDFKMLGGKTGYTPEAGLCMSLFYEYLDKPYLLITSNAPGNPRDGYHYLDGITILNKAHLNK